jgi:hypothetical protein
MPLFNVSQLALQYEERDLNVQEVAGQSNGARKLGNIYTSFLSVEFYQ